MSELKVGDKGTVTLKGVQIAEVDGDKIRVINSDWIWALASAFSIDDDADEPLKVGDAVQGGGVTGTILFIIDDEAWVDCKTNCTQIAGEKYRHLTVKLHELTRMNNDRKWTPKEGMLVERISSGGCIRLVVKVQRGWNYIAMGTDDTCWLGSEELYDFRPRCLKIGDVIEKAFYEDGSPAPVPPGETVTGFDYDGAATTIHPVGGEDFISSSITVHIKGLGPVPWPEEVTG